MLLLYCTVKRSQCRKVLREPAQVRTKGKMRHNDELNHLPHVSSCYCMYTCLRDPCQRDTRGDGDGGDGRIWKFWKFTFRPKRK